MSEASKGNLKADRTNHDPAVPGGLIPVVAFGMSLGIFLGITFILCVGYGLLFPAHPMYPVWAPLLPGFTWLTWPSFFLGLVEAFAYGWYVALIFAPLYNYFISRSR